MPVMTLLVMPIQMELLYVLMMNVLVSMMNVEFVMVITTVLK